MFFLVSIEFLVYLGCISCLYLICVSCVSRLCRVCVSFVPRLYLVCGSSFRLPAYLLFPSPAWHLAAKTSCFVFDSCEAVPLHQEHIPKQRRQKMREKDVCEINNAYPPIEEFMGETAVKRPRVSADLNFALVNYLFCAPHASFPPA